MSDSMVLSRRGFGCALLGAAAAPLVAQTARPLVPWMYMIYPLEQWLTDYERTLDAWEAGGVRGLVIGPLVFFKQVPRFDFTYARPGEKLPTFAPDPKIYQKYGLDAPADAPRDPVKEKQLQAIVANAAARGWEVLFFGPGHYGRRKSFAQDPFGALSLAAGIEDTMRAFPQAKGVVIDGGGEHHYELAFHHGGELLEIRDSERPLLEHLGMDVGRMERGIAHLRERLHHLTPSMVRYYSAGGMMGGLDLFDLNEDALYWLRSRQEVTLRTVAAYRKQIDGLEHKAKFGTIPRATSFSLLTTQDYERIHPYFDYLFPKHYFWNRGFDGMYGTIGRWVQTLGKWNPALREEDCFAAVKCWFGLRLPGVRTLADLDHGFPDEFFSEVVYSETRRALDAVGDDSKVIAWVSTGRNPHAGDPMPAHDLYRILVASQRAGLKRFIYHPDLNLGAAEWSVISGLCGKRWREDPNGYWPPDTRSRKPGTGGGNRKSEPDFTGSNKLRLNGKVALITGASRGIGRAIARRFAEEGARVAVNYVKSRDAAEELCRAIRAAGGTAISVEADVADVSQVGHMVEAAIREFGRIDILVNNAGILKTSTLLDAAPADLDRTIEVNLKGVMHCVRAVAGGMMARKEGKILNLASIGAMGTPFAGTTVYAATKAAVIALTKRLAFELGPYNINVNALAPGFIRSDMTLRDGDLSLIQGKLDLVAGRAMLGRIGEPEDVAGAALFLVSADAGFITAQTLTVDGGRMDFFSHSA